MTGDAQLDFAAQVARLTQDAPALLRRALKTGGGYADLFYEHTLHHRHTLRRQARGTYLQSPVRDAQRQLVEGAGLRVLAGGQSGYAVATDLSALPSLAEAAAGQVRRGPASSPPVPSAAWRRQEGPPLPADAPDVVAASEKATLLEEAADAAFGLDARICRVAVHYRDCVRRTFVATTEGRLVTQASLLVGLRVEVTLEEGSRRVTGHAVGGGACGMGHFFEHPPEQVARAAVAQAQHRAAARPVRSGQMPVVIGGSWGGVWLHEALGHLLEADTAAHHAASFARRLGGRVAELHVTLVDDATLPGGRGSAAFDDEGTPTERAVLVEQGVLRGFLTDRLHAQQLGCPRTGSARRQDFRYPPLPRMSNLLLLPGGDAPQDLVAEVQDGLFVKTVGHGLFQPEVGRFSFEVLEGHRIEQGRLTAPVAGVRLAGETPEVLARIAGVGRDFGIDAARGMCSKAGQVVPVSVGMPTVLVDGLEVG